MCIRIFICNFKKTKSQTAKRHITKEANEEKRISMENLTGYDDIVCQCALLTYLIEAEISPDCSYEFNVVYEQWGKSQ